MARILDDRTPSVTSTTFSDVSVFWYMNQGNSPAPGTRGALMDHFAVSVADLDAWGAKLKAEGVTFLEQTYSIGGHRAIMIEGPARQVLFRSQWCRVGQLGKGGGS